MSDIVQLYDASNNAIYPVTHLRAVRDSSGTTLESMMQDVREITVGYYECSTSGNIAAKTITIDSSVYLSTKILCNVKFVEKNTAANATLNINQTGVKPLYYNGVRVSTNNSWYAGEIVTLFYDGVAFQLNSLPELNEYDVSAKNPTGGPNSDGKFTLAYILSNANTLIPTSVRKGGMSIKFVQSSDNKYVQFRYMLQYAGNTTAENNKFVNPTNWQGVDDEPTAGSSNLVKSGGVYNDTTRNNISKLDKIVGKNLLDKEALTSGIVNSSGKVVSSTGKVTPYIKVTPNTQYILSQTNFYSYVGSAGYIGFYDAEFNTCSTPSVIPNTSPVGVFTTPNDCEYIRCSIASNVVNNDVQLEVGSVRTTYEGYNPAAGYYRPIDSIPTQNSKNAVQSGGVYNSLAEHTAQIANINTEVQNINTEVQQLDVEASGNISKLNVTPTYSGGYVKMLMDIPLTEGKVYKVWLMKGTGASYSTDVELNIGHLEGTTWTVITSRVVRINNYDVNKAKVAEFTALANINAVQIYAQNGSEYPISFEIAEVGTVKESTFNKFTIEEQSNAISRSEINQTKIELSKAEKRVGLNLFDSTNILSGKKYNSSGGITNDANFSISRDFIPVAPSTSYIYWLTNSHSYAGNTGYLTFYDSNFNLCSTPTTISKVFTTPEDCYYIKLSVKNSDIDNTRLNQGNQITYLEPYDQMGGYFDDLKRILGLSSITTPEYELINGVIKTDGTIETSSTSKHTTPIHLNKGDVLAFTCKIASSYPILFITDSEGSYYSPLMYGDGTVGKFTYLATEDCYVVTQSAMDDTAGKLSIKVANMSSIKTLIEKTNKNAEDIKGEDYDFIYPSHVFGVEPGSRAGREVLTMLYPEGMQVKDQDEVKLKINGNRSAMLTRNRGMYATDYNQSVYETNMTFKLSADGYQDKRFTTKFVQANRTNAKNKKILLLTVGASLTEAGWFLGGLKQFADMDDIDIGNINVRLIGHRHLYTHSFTYNNVTKTFPINTEGRAGWSTYGMLNYPFIMRASDTTSANLIDTETAWYLCGLATKTPFDSNVQGQEFESYTGTDEQKISACEAVFGRYKPDYCERLWVGLHTFHKPFINSAIHTFWYYSTGQDYEEGATIPAYNGSASNSIMKTFLNAIIDDPDNVFYDKDRARAYTGDYVWTYKSAFSILKYIERYRTLDDDGNQLYFDANQTTTGTAGTHKGYYGDGTESNYYIGTKITDVLCGEVCMPTFIACGMGSNDKAGLTTTGGWSMIEGWEDMYNTEVCEILDRCCADCPNAKVGGALPRRGGVFNRDDWQDVGFFLDYKFFASKHALEIPIREHCGKLSISKQLNYIPCYFTTSPCVETYGMSVFNIDLNKDIIRMSNDNIHSSSVDKYSLSLGHQILAWIYWCLQ